MKQYIATIDVTFEAEDDDEANALSFNGTVLLQHHNRIVDSYITAVVDEEGKYL